MSIAPTLKYRTFDSLLEDVSVDLKNYALDGSILPGELIKVARRCSYELGLRIYRDAQSIVEISNGHGRLPDDFYSLDFAMICTEYTITEALPQGTTIIDIPIDSNYKPCPTDPDPCAPAPDPCQASICTPCVQLDKCGNEFQLIQRLNTETRTYNMFLPLHLKKSRMVSCNCPNTSHEIRNLFNQIQNNTAHLDSVINEAELRDGWMYTNFETGNVYIAYQADMVDDKGNLLVPDHELINEFYEYALKQRIIENLIFNGEPSLSNLLQLVELRYRTARNNAISLVRTPNFEEMRKLWEVNRKAQYSKYFDMFKSYHPNSFKGY